VELTRTLSSCLKHQSCFLEREREREGGREGEEKQEKSRCLLGAVNAIKRKLTEEHGQLKRTKNLPKSLKFMVRRGGDPLQPKQVL